MRKLIWIIGLFLLAGCGDDDYSCISIHNDTGIPIYALPYTSEHTDGDWIQPGVTDMFYSINCDCLDGYDYFSFYYDSLIIHLKGYNDDPVKFFKDGTTVNYNPTLNPFTNAEVWNSHKVDEDRLLNEHFFSIEADQVKSLGDTLYFELNPAS
ncbi:MAG: hypothetical protein ABFS10_07180 [Bacteroidota bacterium]